MKKYIYLIGPLLSTSLVIYFLFEISAGNLTSNAYTFFLLSIVLMVLFLIVYALHIWKNDNLNREAKLLWLILIFSTSFPVQLIYWGLHLKNDE